MQYRVIKSSSEDFDVITEDGGVSSHYHNGEQWVSSYYTGRLTDLKGTAEEWYDELQEMGVHIQYWEEGMEDLQTIINAALNWLVFPTPDEWQLNDTLFDSIIG